jgi:signal transduction histidine kinase
LISTGEPVGMDVRVPLAGGGERIVHSEARLHCDRDGQPSEMLGAVLDVTVQAHLRDQLRQAQKMEAVGALAGGVAHDFTNYLTVILSLTGLVRSSIPHGDPARDDLDEVLATAERAADLSRQILAFARRQPHAPVAVNQVVASTGRMIQRLIGERIAVDFRLAPGLPPVMADPGLLEQVLLNLAVNARDAMPGGGRLEIGTRAVSDAAGEQVELTVADDGSGMDDATRQRAFDPLFTTKAGPDRQRAVPEPADLVPERSCARDGRRADPRGARLLQKPFAPDLLVQTIGEVMAATAR